MTTQDVAISRGEAATLTLLLGMRSGDVVLVASRIVRRGDRLELQRKSHACNDCYTMQKLQKGCNANLSHHSL